jgi:hypothetical protein
MTASMTSDAPFRSRYLPFAEVEAQLQAWAASHADVCKLHVIGESLEGRPLYVLVIGDEQAPAVWIDANMHATEVCGTNVALGLAEAFLAIRRGEPAASFGLAETLAARLRGVTAFVMPRMSPDGAEAILATSRYVRSVPRHPNPGGRAARWVTHDVNGDGRALLMRREDPCGEFVSLPEMPHVLVPRKLEDPGPYYAIYPEGTIENYDGHTIPEPHFLADNRTDLNRNFPYAWMPEADQVGAGTHAGSEPESKAVIAFAEKHPNLFAWLNLHTFGGVYLRPLGDGPDSKMNQGDLAIFKEIGEFAEKVSGYPMVSGFEEFLYEPEKPLKGDLTDWAYHHRGTFAYVCELWDLAKQVGIEVRRPFIQTYDKVTRADLLKIAAWDREHNQGRVLGSWAPFDHPQLGPVEVGGVDPRFGIWNPPPERLGEVVRAQTTAFLRVAAMLPDVRVSVCSVKALGEGVHLVDVLVENRGYLGTVGASTAARHAWCEPLRAVIEPPPGGAIEDGAALREIGHLDGWGSGVTDTASQFAFARSRGNGSSKRLRVVVRGQGKARITVHSQRIGAVSVEVELGAT